MCTGGGGEEGGDGEDGVGEGGGEGGGCLKLRSLLLVLIVTKLNNKTK